MNQTPAPVNWRTRRGTGTADTLIVRPLEDGAMRIGARGIRVIVSYNEAVMLASALIEAIDGLGPRPQTVTVPAQSEVSEPFASDEMSADVRDTLIAHYDDIAHELSEARMAAAAGDLALTRRWLDLAEKVIGGRITELKQARLQANS